MLARTKSFLTFSRQQLSGAHPYQNIEQLRKVDLAVLSIYNFAFTKTMNLVENQGKSRYQPLCPISQ